MKLIKLAVFLSLVMGGNCLWAAINPYTIGSGSGSSSNSADTTSSTLPVATNSPAPSVKTPAAASATTTTISPQFQYVQAAQTLGQTPPPSSSVTFSQTSKGASSQAALQGATASLGAYGNAPQNANLASAFIPGGGTDVLGQILAVAKKIQVNTEAVSNFTTAASDQEKTGIMPKPSSTFLTDQAGGYAAVSSLASKQNNFDKLDFPSIKEIGMVPNLTQDQQKDAKGPDLDFLNSLTNTDTGTSDAWKSVTTYGISQTAGLYYGSPNTMDALQTAVLSPFGGQADWMSQVSTATSPQLLRMLVVETAISNYMQYQSLARLNEMEMMQASQLRSMTDLQATIKAASKEQNYETSRVIMALQDLTDAINAKNK